MIRRLSPIPRGGGRPEGKEGVLYSHARGASLIRRNVLECSAVRGTRVPRSFRWAPFWRLNAAHLVNEAVIFLSRALCGEPRGPAIKRRNVLECSAVRGTRVPRSFRLAPFHRANSSHSLIRSSPGPPKSTAGEAEDTFWGKSAHLVNEAVIFLSRALCGEPRGRAIKRRNVVECSAVRGTRVPRSFRWAPFWRLNAAHLVNEENVFYARAPPRKRGRPGIKKHPRSSRGCAALAGAIGIEPTPWESEAHVLPLHQAPTRE